MIGKLARGLGILLLAIGLLGVAMAYQSIKYDKDQAAEAAKQLTSDPDFAKPFSPADLFDFEHMKDSNRVLMKTALTLLVVGAISFGLGMLLKPTIAPPVSPVPGTQSGPQPPAASAAPSSAPAPGGSA